MDLRVCNKRVFEALIPRRRAGSARRPPRAVCAALDTAIREASLQQEEIETGQVSMFGDAAGETSHEPSHAADASEHRAVVGDERLAKEKEILGFYISGHPLEPFRTECELFATHTVADLGAAGRPSR